MTFNEVATEWYQVHSVGLCRATQKGYRYNLQHLSPLNEMSICNIKFGVLQKQLNEMAAQGFSQRTVHGVRQTMIMVFEYAVQSEYIDRNPSRHAKMPRYTKDPHQRCLTLPEAIAIEKFEHPYQLFALTLMYTGMRRGEALALTWKDIDWHNNILTVNKAVEFVGNAAVVKTPKTSSGYRTIPLAPPLKRKLQQARTGCSPDSPVFTQITTGRMHTQTSYKKMWEHWYKDFAVHYTQETQSSPQRITAHMLRHYYITFLFEHDIPDVIIQRVAGHAQVAFTRQRYTHLREHFKAQCFQNIINLYQ